MANATAVIRGSKRSHADLCKRARTKQDRATLSGDEAEIMAALNACGLYPIPVYAVDKYNIDFAFPDLMIAVEYNGGNWHNTPKKIAEDEVKAALLSARGWTLLVFPRLAKRRKVDSGNARIPLVDLISKIRQAVHHASSPMSTGEIAI
jgi:very-short-patch-repair endonuclease